MTGERCRQKWNGTIKHLVASFTHRPWETELLWLELPAEHFCTHMIIVLMPEEVSAHVKTEVEVADEQSASGYEAICYQKKQR